MLYKNELSYSIFILFKGLQEFGVMKYIYD